MKKDGFALIEAVLIVVVLIIVGAVSYLAYTNLSKPKTTATQPTSTATQTVTVSNAKDLDTVDKQLDAMSLDDENASKELDSSTNSF